MASYDDWKLREPDEGPTRCECGHEWDDHQNEDSLACGVKGCECGRFVAADPNDDGDWAFDSWRDEQMEKRDEFERSK